jgi:glycosyltransferase involved in cell wall biosynthesis
MPHLLILTSTFPRWENDSQPAFVYELSRRLADQFDVTVLTPRSPKSQKKEFMTGIRVLRFPYFFQKWETLTSQDGGIMNRLRYHSLTYLLIPFFIFGQLWALLRLLNREKIDIIHAHWIIPQGLVAAIAIILARQSIPLIGTSHGGDLYALQGKAFQKLKVWVIRRMARLTVVSRAMKQKVIDMGIRPQKIEVLSMGVDLKNRFVPVPEQFRNPVEILFVGRLVEKKGLDTLIAAMPRILEKFSKVRLTVAGAGPLETRLRQKTEKLGICDKVDFMGMVPQSKLPAFFRRAALAVFPFMIEKNGDQEGLGLVVVEAMGCGCPVIASDLPAIKDSVIHGQTGIITPSGNAKVLADTIIFALQQYEKMENMADMALKMVTEKFDWNVVTGKYCRYLKRVMMNKI